MLKVRQIPRSFHLWGAFNKIGQQVLCIDKKCPGPECEVREYELKHPQGRGALLATFLGPDSLDKACRWARYYTDKPDVRCPSVLPKGGKVVKTKFKSARRTKE